MGLLKETTAKTIDTAAIRRGDLIRAKYKNWEEPCNGIVAYAKPEEIRVLYLTATGYVSNFYTIRLVDVLNGLWEIQWGGDFEHTGSFTPESDGNAGTEPDTTGQDGTGADNGEP